MGKGDKIGVQAKFGLPAVNLGQSNGFGQGALALSAVVGSAIMMAGVVVGARRKPIDKTIDATGKVLVLEMPGDYFELVVEAAAAPATQQVLPSRHNPSARSRCRPGGGLC